MNEDVLFNPLEALCLVLSEQNAGLVVKRDADRALGLKPRFTVNLHC